MGRIRILSDNVANKIAAGEVVERPSSVVKELLENSLDAGATDIRIEVESGGRRLIRITDNGCGMIQDDAMLAFERHATSKLADVGDLLTISTLGFRGEALPSIASVSRLVLETRAAEQEAGTEVELAGGKLLKCDPAALPPGTTITVRDLFFNVPARKKFLRSEQTEIAHIASLVTHYSLAHPDKSFLLRHNGKELLNATPVAELRERVFQVFGSRILDDLIDLGESVRELPVPVGPEDKATREFRLRGFVSGPQVQKSNRNSIYLFVNGRLIRDKLLLHAISAAYHNLIPPSSFPFALLQMDCDAEEVDVNVHPAKTEVRFRHGSIVHDFVRDTIRQILMEQRPVPNLTGSQSFKASASPAFGGSPGQAGAQLPYSEFSQRMQNMDPGSLHEGVDSGEILSWPRSAPHQFGQPSPSIPFPDQPATGFGAPTDPNVDLAHLPEFQLRRASGPPPRFDFGTIENPAQTSPEPREVNPEFAKRVHAPAPDTHGAVFPDAELPPLESLDALRDLRPMGQIHDSFIIAAGRDGLWIIDQHVAHERILFEQVLERRSKGGAESQRLLVPLVIQISPAQQIEYARIADELNSVGFETEPFGKQTIAIKSAPAGLAASDVEKVLFEILEIAERELRKTSVEDLRRDMAASIACRAAIKINTPLEPAKIEWLLVALAATACPMSCPHGRPIALRYTTREILKSFHRI